MVYCPLKEATLKRVATSSHLPPKSAFFLPLNSSNQMTARALSIHFCFTGTHRFGTPLNSELSHTLASFAMLPRSAWKEHISCDATWRPLSSACFYLFPTWWTQGRRRSVDSVCKGKTDEKMRGTLSRTNMLTIERRWNRDRHVTHF